MSQMARADSCRTMATTKAHSEIQSLRVSENTSTTMAGSMRGTSEITNTTAGAKWWTQMVILIQAISKKARKTVSEA